jgi:hypothetical protein
MLFIWFNKLVIVPLELIFVGNKAFLLNLKINLLILKLVLLFSLVLPL